MKKKLVIFSSIFVIIDQLIKLLVSNFIPYNKEISVINNFFYLTNVHNNGAAFSTFEGNLFFIMLMTIVSIVIVYYFFVKNQTLKKIDLLLVSMLYGGIIGNFIDRLLYGYVIDYLGFILINNYHFPIFNLADMCIVISVFLLIIISFKEEICKNIESKKKQEE